MRLSNGRYFPFGGARKWTWANGQVYERTFDLDGRIKTVTLGPATAIYAELSQLFGYDSLSRLITGTLAAGQTRGFTYDANSNRATATVNGTVTNYTYPSSSHRLSGLSGANTKSFSYDNAGNTTQSGPVTLVYDGRGRLKQAGAATYLINGAGQRVAKTVGATTTYFLYGEGGRLIGEYDSDGVPIQETVWLGTTPVATIWPKAPSGYDVFYVWADHLDTPRVVSDSLNVTRWSWEHSEPFGDYAADENPAGAGLFAYNLRFPGQYFDSETGTHYNYFRDYDASLGRYIQSDPIGLKGGLNTFGYANANPNAYTDPTGHAPQLVPVLVGGYLIWQVVDWAGSVGEAWLRQQEAYNIKDARKRIADACANGNGAACAYDQKLQQQYLQCTGGATRSGADVVSQVPDPRRPDPIQGLGDLLKKWR